MFKTFFKEIFALVFLTFVCASYAAATPGRIIDVTVASNGCAAAVANDGIDDHAAIQCQLDYMRTNYIGGMLHFPSGLYEVSQTLEVNGGQQLTGVGRQYSVISSLGGSDIKVLEFNGGHNTYGGMENMGIVCSQSPVATKSCVHVTHNVPVAFNKFRIYGGLHALRQDGVDGRMIDGTISAAALIGANLYSTGANWYTLVRFNPHAGQHIKYAFVQNTWSDPENNGLQENKFTDCDFSGSFDFAVAIHDNNTNQAITKFSSAVFAGPIKIWGAHTTIIDGSEIGNAQLDSDSTIQLSSNVGLQPTVVGGTGSRHCSDSNVNVVC